MNDAYQSDEEQVENLKKWWKENGTSTLLSIAVAMGAVFGWQTWQKHQVTKIENSSQLFQNLIQQTQAPVLSDEQKSTVNHLAGQLKENFAASEYAKYAALYQAKIAAESGDLDGAEQHLRWVLANNPEPSLASLSNYRLARILLAKQQYDNALALIDTQASGYEILNYELQGDILTAQGELERAAASYDQAKRLNESSEAPVNNFILELKQQQLSSQSGNQ